MSDRDRHAARVSRGWPQPRSMRGLIRGSLRDRARTALREIQLLPRRINAAARRLPDFLIIGAQKSGTTSLYHSLVRHPQVRPCLVKEVHFFDQNYHRGTDWYRAHFAAATVGGHVTVEDFATISAFSGVHQFCRVGRHAYIGGYSVVTKDALPFGKSVGNRARIYGLNTIGLARRGFTQDTIAQLKRAYRYLLQSKLNTSRALVEIEQDPTLTSPEVRYLVEFIRSSKRGVILRRPTRRVEELVADE